MVLFLSLMRLEMGHTASTISAHLRVQYTYRHYKGFFTMNYLSIVCHIMRLYLKFIPLFQRGAFPGYYHRYHFQISRYLYGVISCD